MGNLPLAAGLPRSDDHGNFRETLDLLHELAVPELADFCTLEVIRADGTWSRYSADPAEARSDFREVPEILEAAMRLNEPLIIEDPKTIAMKSPDSGLGSAALVVPLIGLGKALGTLTAHARTSTGRWNASQRKKWLYLARLAAASVENPNLRTQVAEAGQERDEVIAFLSQELKTRVAGLGLRVSTLKRELKNALDQGDRDIHSVWELSSQVELQLRRFTTFVEKLWGYTALIVGKCALQPSNLNLNALLQQVAADYAGEFEQSGNVLMMRCDGEILGTWDRGALELVMGNLIANAIRYGCGRPIQIESSVVGTYARVRVLDHGQGIAKEDQVRIFERFKRAAGSENPDGLGLGLYLVKHLVLAQGGSVELESRLGDGAEFTILLPLEASFFRKTEAGRA